MTDAKQLHTLHLATSKDSSAGQASLEQLGLAGRDADWDKVNCFYGWFNPSLQPFFTRLANIEIRANNVSAMKPCYVNLAE